jgi:hypothetical protein
MQLSIANISQQYFVRRGMVSLMEPRTVQTAGNVKTMTKILKQSKFYNSVCSMHNVRTGIYYCTAKTKSFVVCQPFCFCEFYLTFPLYKTIVHSYQQNKTKQNKTKQNRHIGCICPDGWEGDYCEIKIENIASLTTELIHDVEENLTAGKIVAIIIGVGISIALLYYFKRSLFSCTNTTNNTNANNINSNKRGRGRRGRRGRNKGMELSSSSAAAAAADGRNDNTRDII